MNVCSPKRQQQN